MTQIDVTLGSATATGFNYPTVLYQLRFCEDEYRYLFQEELNLVSGLDYEVRQRITVDSPLSEFRVTFTDASAAISNITAILGYRKEQSLARVDPLPETVVPPGDDTPNGDNETGLFTTGYEQDLQISYYLYDHLGNTRIVFHTVLDCDGEVDYVAEYVADYYPFGKILREWVACDQERYLTTYHERDKESGYDYRGARFYDSDLGRFLSVDPLAKVYAAWSTYHYAADNPVLITDPTGMAWSPVNQQLANTFGVFGNGGEGYSGGYASLSGSDPEPKNKMVYQSATEYYYGDLGEHAFYRTDTWSEIIYHKEGKEVTVTETSKTYYYVLGSDGHMIESHISARTNATTTFRVEKFDHAGTYTVYIPISGPIEGSLTFYNSRDWSNYPLEFKNIVTSHRATIEEQGSNWSPYGNNLTIEALSGFGPLAIEGLIISKKMADIYPITRYSIGAGLLFGNLYRSYGDHRGRLSLLDYQSKVIDLD